MSTNEAIAEEKKQNGNMDIWDQVSETPFSHTKKNNNLTAISSLYPIMKATEIFGPVGCGWGYKILEERYDEGAPMIINEVNYGPSKIHTILLSLWYKRDGEVYEVSQFGHTKFLYVAQNSYVYQDEEAPKKSLTDAIKKCLSLLGFCADVFLGEYDDKEYQSYAQRKEQAEKNNSQIVLAKEVEDEIAEWCKKESKAYEMLKNKSSLKRMHSSLLAQLNNKCHPPGIDPERYAARFEQLLKERIEALEAEKKGNTNE